MFKLKPNNKLKRKYQALTACIKQQKYFNGLEREQDKVYRHLANSREHVFYRNKRQ